MKSYEKLKPVSGKLWEAQIGMRRTAWRTLLAGFCLLTAGAAWAEAATNGAAAEISSVLAHPPFEAFYSCTEHWDGQFVTLGDALGVDCVVQRLTEVGGHTWLRAYADDGMDNTDWYGWHENVLSPCDCKLVDVESNAVENIPGVTGKPPASYVILARADGVFFSVAHLRSIQVQKGDLLKEGQSLAKVGNNGYARHPHVHLGAWKGRTPLQIRFDQRRRKVPPGP